MLVTSALLFIRRTKGDMNFEPIPPKPYSMPLVIDLIAPSGQIYNRMIYTYNSKGLETSIKTGSEEGYERTNYKYEGKKSSYTDVFYDVNNNRYQTECITHFGDTKYTRPLKMEKITTFHDGTRDREVYTYNSKGLETSCQKYVEDILDSERIKYNYEKMKSSYTEVWYTTNGEKVRLMNYTATFEDTEYKRPLVIELAYSSPYNDTKYTNRVVYTYNAQGLEIGRKNYSGDKLTHERKDYTYEDKKSSYIEVFNDGLSTMGFKTNITYLF